MRPAAGPSGSSTAATGRSAPPRRRPAPRSRLATLQSCSSTVPADRVRIALATFAGLPHGVDADLPLVRALAAADADVTYRVWDDPGVEWDRFDRVMIRSVYDYAHRRGEFVAWAHSVGDRLRNRPEVVEWTSHKRYIDDLA